MIAEKYMKDLEREQRLAITDALDELAEMARVYLRMRLSYYGLGDSSLINAVDAMDVTRYGFRIKLLLYGESLEFVEYGTGIVGQNAPHPQAGLHGWSYDTNGHGTDGWWYPTTYEKYGKRKYQTKNGDWLAWTMGMEPRPFLYDTYVYLRMKAPEVQLKHMRKRGIL
jgi:hypothetical protein